MLVGMTIPTTFHGVALQAVASADQRLIVSTALTLGMSAPALVQAVVGLLEDPQVVMAHARPVRVIRERLERQRAARDASRLTHRLEV